MLFWVKSIRMSNSPKKKTPAKPKKGYQIFTHAERDENGVYSLHVQYRKRDGEGNLLPEEQFVIPLIWVIFGSSTSTDIDVALLFPMEQFFLIRNYDSNMSAITEQFDRIAGQIIRETYDPERWNSDIEEYFYLEPNNNKPKVINSTLCGYRAHELNGQNETLSFSKIDGAFKGFSDEVHNSFIMTYWNHPQMYHKIQRTNNILGTPFGPLVKRSVSAKVCLSSVRILNYIYHLTNFYPYSLDSIEDWRDDMEICKRIAKMIFSRIISIQRNGIAKYYAHKYGCDRYGAYTLAVDDGNFTPIIMGIFTRVFYGKNLYTGYNGCSDVKDTKRAQLGNDPFHTVAAHGYLRRSKNIMSNPQTSDDQKVDQLYALFVERCDNHEIPFFIEMNDPTTPFHKLKFTTKSMITVPKMASWLVSLGNVGDMLALLELYPWHRTHSSKLMTLQHNDDHMKNLAFQLGQSYALLLGIKHERKHSNDIFNCEISHNFHLFQKHEIASFFPQLEKFLNRSPYEDEDIKMLSMMFRDYVATIRQFIGSNIEMVRDYSHHFPPFEAHVNSIRQQHIESAGLNDEKYKLIERDLALVDMILTEDSTVDVIFSTVMRWNQYAGVIPFNT